MITTVIFDMDSVISDTQKLHSAAEAEILCSSGVKISTEEITERYAGVPAREIFRLLMPDHEDIEALCKELVTRK